MWKGSSYFVAWLMFTTETTTILQPTLRNQDVSLIEHAVHEAVRSSAAHDVTVLVDYADDDDFTSKIVDIVRRNVSKHPTLFRSTKERHEVTKYVLTSRSLFIGVCSYTEHACNVISILNKLTHPRHNPKCLIIFTGTNKNWQFYFEMLWYHKYINSVILEIRYRSAVNQAVSVIVHQYNNFVDYYGANAYSCNFTDWFPDKVKNLYGKPLVITTPTIPPLKSSAFYWLDFLIQVMNFTSEFVLTTGKDIPDNETMAYLPASLEVVENFNENFDFGVAVQEHTVRLIIPRIRIDSNAKLPWRFVLTFFLGLVFMTVMIIAMIMLKIRRSFRHPMNVLSIIIGAGVLRKPKAFVEGVLYICLVITSGRYMSMFYTELYNTGLSEDTEINVGSLEELAKLNMPVSHTWYKPKGDFLEYLQDKLIYVDWTDMPIWSADFADVERTKKRRILFTEYAHIIVEDIGNYILKSMRQNNESFLAKYADFIVQKDYSYHLLSKRSPYKQRINDILLRANEGNLRQKAKIILSRRQTNIYALENKEVSGESYIILSMLYGYSLAIVVLLTEVVVHQISEWRKRVHLRRNFLFHCPFSMGSSN